MKMRLGILICHGAVWLVHKASEALPVFSAVIRFTLVKHIWRNVLKHFIILNTIDFIQADSANIISRMRGCLCSELVQQTAQLDTISADATFF